MFAFSYLHARVLVCVYLQHGVTSLDLVARTYTPHRCSREMVVNEKSSGRGSGHPVTPILNSVWGAWAQPDAAERNLRRVGAGTETSDDGECSYSWARVYLWFPVCNSQSLFLQLQLLTLPRRSSKYRTWIGSPLASLYYALLQVEHLWA